ncbi:AAA family ATPase [Gilvimarinus sp. SDUM040013]|uniref:AAA family ATPase n=1 Tax=Gilvimarinus gilvus TaxID=3058038 RepID=A0ABU4RTM5_9GAMM|nr:AAA family ATPase [Gilvimarinus sp. SDUM040013]MDO3386838.1 AAA family ATPase [Gilvimarinus sp. SDUM040013]MDX6848232.1 AAA family ATPase [Gilvimarinus sp. SDUM040013]
MDTTLNAIASEPFLNKPSPQLFFESENHTKGWQFLKSALKSAEPHLIVAGPYGAGKTLLCLKLVEHLKESAEQPFVYVSTPAQNYAEMLRQACSALNLKVSRSVTKQETLASHIYRHFEQNPDDTLVILLDDVQEYDASTLNQIRMLANYNVEGKFPVRLFLFAHSHFYQRLKSADLESLDQRIKRRFHLEGLSFEEVKEYIYFQMLEAGMRGSPFFPDDTIREITKLSEGLPRRINNLCDNCILIGDKLGKEIIDRSILAEGAKHLGLQPLPPVIDAPAVNGVDSAPMMGRSIPIDASLSEHADDLKSDLSAGQPEFYAQADDASEPLNSHAADSEPHDSPDPSSKQPPRSKIDLGAAAPWATWIWRATVVVLLTAIAIVAFADGAVLPDALSEIYNG